MWQGKQFSLSLLENLHRQHSRPGGEIKDARDRLHNQSLTPNL
jgi:hypothetical protein